MLSRRDFEEILQVAGRGGNFAEIFIEQRESTRISCEDRKLERVITGEEQGAGIRVVTGENTAYGYTNAVDRESLITLAQQVGAATESDQAIKVKLEQRHSSLELHIARRPDLVPVEEKVALIRRAEEAARGVDRQLIRQVTVGFGDVIQKVWIANTTGVYVEDERVRTRLSVNAVVSGDGVIQTGFASAGGTQGLELFDEDTPESLGKQAARRALLMLKAKLAPAGKMVVVLAGEAGGTMIHEACGHGLEADLVQKGLSVYAGKLGQQVASELVTVVDDGTIPGRYGSYRFDDEGNPSQRNVLIEQGILKGYIYDQITANHDGVHLTGNGRRESFQHRPIPRMTTTYLAPGVDDPEEIIRDTPAGLLVRRMGGGQVNTTNGEFVFEVSEGYLIENGQVTVPVRGATLTGNGPAVLQQIDRIGKDFGYSIGTCGKEGQGVPVADAQPTIRIPELVVGGILGKEGDGND